MADKRAQVYIGSKESQEMLDHYHLVIDGKLVMSLDFLNPKYKNDSYERRIQRCEDIGFLVADELAGKGLGNSDLECVNAEESDRGYEKIRILNEAVIRRFEEFKEFVED